MSRNTGHHAGSGQAKSGAGTDDRILIESVQAGGSTFSVFQQGRTKVLEIDGLWQGENRRTHQIMAAHAPMMLLPSARRVCGIGLGAGTTFRRMLMYDIERIDCVELEQAVVDLARRHFDGAAWMDDPRVRMIVGDGAEFLRSEASEQYDLISIEVGQTIAASGPPSFYTREFLELARSRLNKDGIVANLVPIISLTTEEFLAIVRAFIEVLPAAVLWWNANELLLIGGAGREPKLSARRLELLRNDARIREDLAYSQWGGRPFHLNDRANFAAGFLIGPSGLRAMVGGQRSGAESDLVIRAKEAWDPEQNMAREAAITELVRRNLQPIETVLEECFPESELQRARSVREKNLANIASAGFGRWALVEASKDRLDSALACMGKAWAANPDSVIAAALYGPALLARGRASEAADVHRRILASDSENAEARAGLGNALFALGRYAEARDQYEEALRINPNLAEVRNNLGSILHREGRASEAAQQFAEAVRLSPGNAKWLTNLATALAGAGKAAESIERFEEAARLDPENADLHYNWGNSLLNAGRFLDAVERYRRALQLRPQFAEALANLGTALRAAGKPGEAVQRFREALKLNPRLAPAHFGLGVALLQMKKADEAEPALREALKHAPALFQAHEQLGVALLQRGRKSEAAAAFRAALAINPAYGPARKGLEEAGAD